MEAAVKNIDEMIKLDADYAVFAVFSPYPGTESFEETVRELDIDNARRAFGDVLATLSVAAPLSAPAALAVDAQLEELDRHLAVAG